MTLTLELSPALEQSLIDGAASQGLEVADYTLELVQRALQRERNQATIALLRSFIGGDGEEQSATWQALQQGLIETRRLNQQEN